MRNYKNGCLLAAASLFMTLSACAVEPDELEDSVDKTEQAFWESTCNTYSASDDANPSLGACSGGYSYASATSPDATYGQPLCTHAFISRSPFTKGITHVSADTTDGISQADCANTHVVMRTYIINLAGEFELPAVSATGVWWGGAFATCSVGSTVGSDAVAQTVPTNWWSGTQWYETLTVRTVVTAYTGTTYRPVRSTFRKPC